MYYRDLLHFCIDRHNSAKMKKKSLENFMPQESTQSYTTMQFCTRKNSAKKKNFTNSMPSFTLMWDLCRAEEDSRLIQVFTVLGTAWEARLIRFLIREFLRRLATGLQKRQCWHKGWEDEEAIYFSHLLKVLIFTLQTFPQYVHLHHLFWQHLGTVNS